ncbi:MAG TPA: 3-isopropylmalate dehydratase small subunit [Candidatus Binataceae bacterium]|nr:3-isopropylmalate dehydratase small subunit [Candidatus Binataceae bacterium]
MQAFKTFTGLVAPLDRPNVDTDAIIPKQFLKAIVRKGMGEGLFFDWRRNPDGSPNPDFILNQPRYREATILLARANFGIGSSREHAVWALADQGFRAVIAPSFGDIFHNNSLKNGFLPIKLSEDQIDGLFARTARQDLRLTINLETQTVSDDAGWSASFEIDTQSRTCLLEGLDDIALTLRHEAAITAYEKAHPVPYRAHA